jgi:two-component system sensor histidine kinase/response regulator
MNDKNLALNLPELLALLENDDELLAELVGMFREQFPLLRESLDDAVARQDMKSVEIAGHTMKGMLSNLRANRAALAAGKIEQLGRERESAGLKDALSVFEIEVIALRSELDAYMAESQT